MSETQEWNTLRYLDKSWIASKSASNARIEGYNLKNCAIDTMKISTLGEYLANKRKKEDPLDLESLDYSLIDDKNLAKRFVVPVTLPNGKEVEAIVDYDGRDEARILVNPEEGEKEFEITIRLKNEIEKMTPENMQKVIKEEVYNSKFLPDTLDEYAEKVQKDELIPKSKKHAAQMAGISSEELLKKQEEREEAEKEIPVEARDTISKICSENDLDIADLIEVMEIEPQVIKNNLEETGIREENGRVYCLRFRDGGNLQGRVVLSQGEKIVDDRRYDNYMTDYMNEHRGQKRIRETECEHDKISYTDLHGNTTVCEITREPRDINCSDKELLQAEMEKLDRAQEQIKSADMPLEKKAEEMIKINQKRMDIFKSYGVEVPLVENEIEADMEIAEEVNQIEEEKNEYKEEQEENDGYERLTPAEEAMKKRGF